MDAPTKLRRAALSLGRVRADHAGASMKLHGCIHEAMPVRP
jgi:hypothetical protein